MRFYETFSAARARFFCIIRLARHRRLITVPAGHSSISATSL